MPVQMFDGPKKKANLRMNTSSNSTRWFNCKDKRTPSQRSYHPPKLVNMHLTYPSKNATWKVEKMMFLPWTDTLTACPGPWGRRFGTGTPTTSLRGIWLWGRLFLGIWFESRFLNDQSWMQLGGHGTFMGFAGELWWFTHDWWHGQESRVVTSFRNAYAYVV